MHATLVVHMGNIWTYLRTAMIANGIIYRHIHEGERRGLPSRLENAIVDVLKRDETCGTRMYVHWGVYESGKSWAASNAAIRLQNEHAKVVMLRHGWDFTYKTTVRDWLRVSIGVPDDCVDAKISTFLPDTSRTVMILDHCEYLIKYHGVERLVDGLRELDIPVLILVNSWERAVELSNSGCQLLGEPGFARWTEDELNELLKTYPEEIHAKDSATWLSLMGVGVLSGSPGIFMAGYHERGEKSKRANMRRAKLMNDEWVNGILALSGEDMADTTGRFPDKNGTFHWD